MMVVRASGFLFFFVLGGKGHTGGYLILDYIFSIDRAHFFVVHRLSNVLLLMAPSMFSTLSNDSSACNIPTVPHKGMRRR